MGNDRISIIHEVTMDTLATIKSNTQSVTPEEVRSQIMENVRGAVRLENIVREKGEKIRLSDYGKCPWCCQIGKYSSGKRRKNKAYRNLITTTSSMGFE